MRDLVDVDVTGEFDDRLAGAATAGDAGGRAARQSSGDEDVPGGWSWCRMGLRRRAWRILNRPNPMVPEIRILGPPGRQLSRVLYRVSFHPVCRSSYSAIASRGTVIFALPVPNCSSTSTTRCSMTARDRPRCTLPYADSTLRVRGTCHGPRRLIRPPAAAIVDAVPASSCGSEARASRHELTVRPGGEHLVETSVQLLVRNVPFGVRLLQALHGRVAVLLAAQ